MARDDDTHLPERLSSLFSLLLGQDFWSFFFEKTGNFIKAGKTRQAKANRQVQEQNRQRKIQRHTRQTTTKTDTTHKTNEPSKTKYKTTAPKTNAKSAKPKANTPADYCSTSS
jgi:hypothetical protein